MNNKINGKTNNEINDNKNKDDLISHFKNFINKIIDESKNFRSYKDLSNIVINFARNIKCDKELPNFLNSIINNKIINQLNKIGIEPEKENEIKMIHQFIKGTKKIKILDNEFISKNKNNCSLEFNGNEYELREFFDINDDNIEKAEIILKGTNKIKSARSMFFECPTLFSIKNMYKWDTTNLTDISYMFYGCELLKDLDGISKWNTSNIKDMSYLFFRCKSLNSIPDISKWNTKKVTNMSNMFGECASLESLKDISNWDTSNVEDMNSMFFKCITKYFKMEY